MNYIQFPQLTSYTQPILTCPAFGVDIAKNPFTIDTSTLFCKKTNFNQPFTKMSEESVKNMSTIVDNIIKSKTF